jgi:hypothetical protein
MSLNSRGIQQVGRLITFLQANPNSMTVDDVMNHLGCSYQMAMYWRKAANELLYTRGLCIPKPRYADGWVWKLTDRWHGDIREAVGEMVKYLTTMSRTVGGYADVAYNAPGFVRNSSEGRALNRVRHSMAGMATAAQDAKDEIEASIVRNP